MIEFVCEKDGNLLSSKMVSSAKFPGKNLFPFMAAPAPAPASASAAIKHVVVLVMENRSFDHMLGCLPTVDGWVRAAARGTPIVNGTPGSKSVKFPATGNADPGFTADPGHNVGDVYLQMYGTGGFRGTYPPGPAPMSGFITSFGSSGHAAKNPPQSIMDNFTPATLPVLTTLATEFAVFDCWHASVPGPTFPNRYFFHAATSSGIAKGNAGPGGNKARTVFQDMDECPAKPTWNIFYGDFPGSLEFAYLTGRKSRVQPLSKFYAAAAAGTLPNYSFLEPNYFTKNGPERDQHPMKTPGQSTVTHGEELIAQVYTALRRGPRWNNTLFLITYDEHGGFMDHVPPPACPNPDGKVATGAYPCDFTRLGVRVPAVAVSPWIRRGTVVSKPNLFEHSSVPRAIHELFVPGYKPLTKREAFAAPFHSAVLNLTSPRTDTVTVAALPTKLRAGAETGPRPGSPAPSNDLQRHLVRIARGLLGPAASTRAKTTALLTAADADVTVAGDAVDDVVTALGLGSDIDLPATLGASAGAGASADDTTDPDPDPDTDGD